jgi:hypothetical protein
LAENTKTSPAIGEKSASAALFFLAGSPETAFVSLEGSPAALGGAEWAIGVKATTGCDPFPRKCTRANAPLANTIAAKMDNFSGIRPLMFPLKRPSSTMD